MKKIITLICFILIVIFSTDLHNIDKIPYVEYKPQKNENYYISKSIIDVIVYNRFNNNIMNKDEMKKFAYQIGSEYNISETINAIIFLETNFGKRGRIGDNGIALGITQIQIPTARFILRKIMNINCYFSDNELKMLLTKNDKLCIIMTKHYLLYLKKKFKNKKLNWSHSLLSYNVGPTKVLHHGLKRDPNKYLKKALQFIKKERKNEKEKSEFCLL